jgi:anti-anti-sigma factor
VTVIDLFRRAKRDSSKGDPPPVGAPRRSQRPELLTTDCESSGEFCTITVNGEIDEHTADLFVRKVQEQMKTASLVIVDLWQVTFLGTAGHHALHRLQMSHYETGTDWVVVPSAAVRRSLQLFSTGDQIPTAATVESAAILINGRDHKRTNE